MADIKLLGNSGSGFNAKPSANYFRLERFQAEKSGTVTSIKMFAYSSPFNAKVAIYSDNAGSPDALLGSGSGTINGSYSWIAIGITDVPIVAGTYYWLAHCINQSYLWASSSGGTGLYKSATYSSFSFPNPAGSGFTNGTYTYAHQGWGAEGGAAGNPMFAYAQQ